MAARGQRPGSTQAAYSASKAAVLNLTESTALHCGENRLPIRCNAICPGVIDTPLMRAHAAASGDGGLLEAMAKLQVTGRLGQPREVAEAALFLASDEASFVTGATLNVDGGFRIRDR
jgi:NAD(P)-dependent dehydrogenase (short-subunit alcohol dehydrogenase family)